MIGSFSDRKLHCYSTWDLKRLYRIEPFFVKGIGKNPPKKTQRVDTFGTNELLKPLG